VSMLLRMTAGLSPGERAHLDEEGWLHLPAVLDEASVGAVRAAW